MKYKTLCIIVFMSLFLGIAKASIYIDQGKTISSNNVAPILNQLSNMASIQTKAASSTVVGNRIYDSLFTNQSVEFITLATLIAVIALLILAILILLKQLMKKPSNVEYKATKFLTETIQLLTTNNNVELYLGDAVSGKVYKYESGSYHLYSHSIHDDLKMIHPDDVDRFKALFEQITVSKEDCVITEFRQLNINSIYCYYEFMIRVIERDNEGRVLKYLFSRRDCSKDQEALSLQKELVDGLNHSLKAGKLFRWVFNITTQKSKIFDSLGRVYELDETAINSVLEKDREKVNTFIEEQILGINIDSHIDIWIHNEESNEYALYRVSTTVENDSKNNPIFIHGILKDITHEYRLNEELAEYRKNIMVALEIGNLATWSYECKEGLFYMLPGGHKGVYSEYGIAKSDFFLNYIHPDDRDELISTLGKVETGELDRATETFRYRIGDEWRWILTSVTPIIVNEEITSILGIRRDVTAEVEHRQSLVDQITQIKEYGDELFGVLDNLPIAVALKNMVTNEYTFVNKLARSQFGLEKDVTSSYKIVSSTLGRDLERAKEGGVYEAEELLELNDGNIIETMVRSKLVKYNQTIHALISRIDLTESNKAKRSSTAMSKYMLMMKGYTWFIDTRTNVAVFEHNMELEQDISKFTEATQILAVVHEEDREKCADYINWLMEGDLDGEKDTLFRLDIEKKGVYEWWEALASVEIIRENGEEYRLLSGIVINVHARKKAELELNKLHNQKELIFNNMSSILVYINKDFEVQWSNSNHILGEELNYIYKQGRKCYESFGLNAPCTNCPALKAMCSGEMVSVEFTSIPDNNIYESTANAIKGSSGIEGVVLKLDNITELKKLIAELGSTNQLMSKLFEELPTSFFIKDINEGFKYVFASSVFCNKVVNKSREEIIGFNDYEIFDDIEIANKFRRDDLSVVNNCAGEIVSIGEEHVVNNGEECFVETRKLHLKLPNNRAFLIGQASDVTEIRKINHQLKIAKEKAEQAGKLKSAFLANMSHEIRTPLNAIVGFSELLKHTEDSVEKEEYMKIIDTNNELLLQLIGDILDLSRIESGSVELCLEEFDFSSFFQETYTTLRPRCEKSEVKLRIDNPFNRCLVRLDKHRCLQLLTNYLNNAVKFTQYGYIQMGYDYRDEGLLIYVKDTGIGISSDKMQQLFQRFEKLNDFAQGTGLGLSICKAIAETMGGRVWAESEEAKGSSFFAWIPCEAELGMETNRILKDERIIGTEKSKPLTITTAKKNILVAEDNRSNYILVQAILKECNLTWAKNGKEAIQYAKQHKYDIILMDLRMPIIGGIAATLKIREFDKDTAIIALTANAFDADRLDALNAGCNHFIAKPLKKEDLLNVIN